MGIPQYRGEPSECLFLLLHEFHGRWLGRNASGFKLSANARRPKQSGMECSRILSSTALYCDLP